ncbi:Glycosyltransferases involved in cell wall biogenesis [Streptomyces sp. LamerLS-316]|uniref:glycosyltransferase family 2 protein n=1 Tax=unclassified Streptomyces TaxID=2593676 RepID=UPI000823F2A5|nr:glycosyltransferase family 2 protein [Streptomyces sp. LamerLS-316]MYQ42650.1 glycosyltransferase [Streptomyces sp. SID4921]SCK32112.1 Glycosyltransferases involved in cell wall biogenesis [Streptomyces sp. LamerLS-316]
MPKLSVVVPFHNVGAYADTTLGSLARNAGPDIEFLLVDDCSTDDTPAVVDRWADRLPHAEVIRHEKNVGIAAARNSGIDAARGDFVTFLDGDDWYAPGHLARLLHAATELDCDFARTDHVQATGTSRVVRRAPARLRDTVLDPREGIAAPEWETMVDYPFVWAGVYHRRLFEDGGHRFTTRLRTAEDRLWIWQLHLRARTCAALNLYGVFYRRGVTTSLTQIKDSRQLDFFPAYDTLLDEIREDPDAELFLPKAVRTYCAMIAFHNEKADAYEPATFRRLRQESAAALHRMPQQVLDHTLTMMDTRRSTLLHRLRDKQKAA